MENMKEFWTEALAIWESGGWAMWAIAAIALVMFAMGMHVHLVLRRKAFLAVPEERWRQWIEHPSKREGPIGELLDAVTGGASLKDTSTSFKHLRMTETVPLARDLRVMKICVSAAPLVGLLGTVTGMLATFSALSAGSGGEQTMGLVAKGISEALITTETGLVIALPGLFLQYQLVRKFERYKTFLAHLQTVCTQVQYRRLKAQERERRALVLRGLQEALS
jgi:biopolymer transport protein ExbB